MVVLGVGIGGMSRSGAGGAGCRCHRVVSFSAGSEPWATCRQKQKQKKPVRKGRGRPAFSHRLTLRRTLRTLLPDCPSSRLPSCFFACAAKAKPLQRVPAKSGGDASQSLTQRRKYIAQSGGRKKTLRLALCLPPVCRRVLVARAVKTVGGGWLPGHTSTKKLANFTPAPLALIPTAPAAAITLSLTCTSSSRRKKSDSWLPRRENSSRPTRRGALRAPS